MSISAARDLFLHERSDAYGAENIVLKALPVMARGVDNEALAEALKEHEKETTEQIRNLDEVFKLLGEKPEQLVCHGAEGLKKEYDAFVKEKPSKDVLTLFTAGAAGTTEHYEIQSYSGLVDMAKLLEENLEQEEAMAKKAESLEKKLGKALASASGTSK